MSIKQYFKTKILDPNEDDEDIETDIISQNEESNSEMELGLEEETHFELPNSNHKYIKKLYFVSRKTGTFQKEWLGVYSWLIYDASKNLMFCSLCKFHKKQNKFGKEGNNFKSLKNLNNL